MNNSVLFISARPKHVSGYYWEPDYWRCKIPADALKDKGYQVFHSPRIINPISNIGTPMSDPPRTIVLHNTFDDIEQGKITKSDMIKAYKDLYGTRIIFDTDDNILMLMDNHNLEGLENIKDGQIKELKAFLDMADYITATRDEYADLLKSYKQSWADKYRTLPNCLPNWNRIIKDKKDINLINSKPIDNRFIFPNHSLYGLHDIKEYKDDLNWIYRNNIILELGKNGNLKDRLGFNYPNVSTVNFNLNKDTYFNFLKDASSNGGYIGILRLLSQDQNRNQFNKYKSNIKVLEAGLAGMGLLTDIYTSPQVYQFDTFSKDVQNIYINNHRYAWLPPRLTGRIYDKYKITNWINQYEEVYFK